MEAIRRNTFLVLVCEPPSAIKDDGSVVEVEYAVNDCVIVRGIVLVPVICHGGRELKCSNQVNGCARRLRFSAQRCKVKHSPKKTQAPGIAKRYRLPGNYPHLPLRRAD